MTGAQMHFTALLDLLINFMAENKRKDNMDYYTFLFYRLNEKLPISEAEERELNNSSDQSVRMRVEPRFGWNRRRRSVSLVYVD